MNATPALFNSLAQALFEAEKSRTEIDPLTKANPDLTLDDAYCIQRTLVSLGGNQIVGLKAALTSKAKQIAMGVDQAGYGILLASMQVDGKITRSELIHPRVEPEIALFFDNFLQTSPLTAWQVAERSVGFAPAFEVIDSRYLKFKFSAVDVYADNCSSARFTVSHDIWETRFQDLNLSGVVFEKNGEVVQTGTPAAVLGSPYASAAFLLNLAFHHKVELPKKFLVLTGGITEAVPVEAGDFLHATFGGIGEVSLRVA